MEKTKEKTKETKVETKVETKTLAPKKTNKTLVAFGKSKGCFIINDPKFML